MAFLGLCYGCRANEHMSHQDSFDTPPPEAGFVCGGGICVCETCVPDMAVFDTKELREHYGRLLRKVWT